MLSKSQRTCEANPGLTREQRSSKHPVGPRTINIKRLPKAVLELGRLMYPETDYYKPSRRSECANGPRPCPYVSCTHHLYVDVSPSSGNIQLNFPDLEVWEMGESCSLDVADRGDTTLGDIGAVMNLTRERIRQLELKALAKVERAKERELLLEHWGAASEVVWASMRRGN